MCPHLGIKVAAINPSAADVFQYPREVEWTISQDNKLDYRKVAQAMNRDRNIEAVMVQHEYGIFGGEWGEYINEFARHCQKPLITALHTVLPDVEPTMHRVTQELLTASKTVVVMSRRSEELLRAQYNLDNTQVVNIPHGIHPVIFQPTHQVKPRLGLTDKIVLTTFGFLSRNKGIEYVLESLPEVIKRHPQIRYLVIGSTHPVVRRHEGESYRLELLAKVKQLHLERHVTFIDKYLNLNDLLTYLQGTDIYLATSLDPEQAVSGTFSYAVGTGRAVISTAFTQARELITPDMGRVIPPRNASAYTTALIELLSNKVNLPQMHRTSYQNTRSMLWTNVADEYIGCIDDTTPNAEICALPKPSLKHLQRMTNSYGLIQFAETDRPITASGYTLDDNSRALIAACLWGEQYPKARQELHELMSTFFRQIRLSHLLSGELVNYLAGSTATQTGQNQVENLEDSLGRNLWGLARVMTCSWLKDQSMKTKAKDLFVKDLSRIAKVKHLRSVAFSLMGITAAHLIVNNRPLIESLASRLVSAYKKQADDSWRWFEPQLAYANGLLPASLLMAAQITTDISQEVQAVGLESLEFLIGTTFYGDVYVPIGQRDWFKKQGYRSFFDQQPEDPAAMMIALHQAFNITGQPRYRRLIYKCFTWYLGNNITGVRMYDDETGGSYDGLTQFGVNKNQGAESLVSYLMARALIQSIHQNEAK